MNVNRRGPITDGGLFILSIQSERYLSIQFSFMDIRACLLFDEANRERYVARIVTYRNLRRCGFKLLWKNISSWHAGGYIILISFASMGIIRVFRMGLVTWMRDSRSSLIRPCKKRNLSINEKYRLLIFYLQQMAMFIAFREWPSHYYVVTLELLDFDLRINICLSSFIRSSIYIVVTLNTIHYLLILPIFLVIFDQ